MGVQFDYEKFEPILTMDEDSAVHDQLSELSGKISGRIILDHLEIGRMSDESGAASYWVVHRRNQLHDQSWNKSEIRNAIQLDDEIAELLIDWHCALLWPANGSSEGRQLAEQVDESIDAVISLVRSAESHFTRDLLADLGELKLCLRVGAWRASMALAGRVLELSLKLMLSAHDVEYEPNLMVGALLRLVEERRMYTDPSLKNVQNLINQQRIYGVHFIEGTPIPTKDQAYMVAHAICDTVRRAVEIRKN
jgi:hypothetical protein